MELEMFKGTRGAFADTFPEIQNATFSFCFWEVHANQAQRDSSFWQINIQWTPAAADTTNICIGFEFAE